MDFKFAPAWKRLVAYLIDYIVITLLSVLIGAIFGVPFSKFNWLDLGIFMAYYIFMDQRYEGTLGKKALRLKVIRTNGQRVNLKASFFRNFGKIVSTLPLGWGFIRILTPSYPQAIHDELARCYVIEKEKK